MVLRHVQHRARVELEARRGLELVAGELDHERVDALGARRLQGVEHRNPDVADGGRTAARGKAHRVRERGHRGLAVRAGHS